MPSPARHLQSKPSTRSKPRPAQVMLLAGVAFLALLVLVSKQMAAPPAGKGDASAPTELPAVQLQRALDAGEPILAFYHSMTCAACKEMTATVAQVFPAYADDITLVDVDVYDARNEELMTAAGIRAIPTVVFIDRNGISQMRLGTMKAADLRAMLDDLRRGERP